MWSQCKGIGKYICICRSALYFVILVCWDLRVFQQSWFMYLLGSVTFISYTVPYIISYHNHIVVLKRQNHLKVRTDKPRLKVKMQLVSDDDVRKRLLEKPRFELAAKGVFRHCDSCAISVLVLSYIEACCSILKYRRLLIGCTVTDKIHSRVLQYALHFICLFVCVCSTFWLKNRNVNCGSNIVQGMLTDNMSERYSLPDLLPGNG